VLVKRYFEAKGLKAFVTSPQKFSIEGEKVYAEGEEVHLVYRRVITRELIERIDEVGAFIEGAKKALVCMCNPFRSFIVGNKKILDLLTNERFQYIYDREELEVIKKTVPWTKILADRQGYLQWLCCRPAPFRYGQ
jgi:hypothetical protein